MTLTKSISTGRSTPYAVSADFCRVFEEDIDGLYSLSLLLTADRAKAEECFVSGLEDSKKSNRVFKDWARSWSRRLIVQNAIRVIAPTPDPAREKGPLRTIDASAEAKSEGGAMLNGVLALPTFERFVFVMSVLEHYSDHDCLILLKCTRSDVTMARTRAAQRIASVANPSLPAASGQVGVLAEARMMPASAA